MTAMPAAAMDNMVDLIGFVLLGVSAATAFLCLIIWRSHQTRRPIAFGLSLVLFFVTTMLMSDRLLPLAGLGPDAQQTIDRMLASLACLTAAFSFDAILKRFVWFGSLREGQGSAVPNILIGLASLGIYACSLMIIASLIFQRDITAIAATSGVLAVVLGYSAQPTLSEVFAGLALNISRPFRTGDSVQINGIWGVIVESGWRSVSLRTYEGTLIVLPNSKAASLRLTNLDMPTHQLRHHIPFTIDIDVPPGRVQAIGVAAMKVLPHVLKSPAPMVLFKNVTEHGMAYEAIFWHDDPNVYILRRDEVGSALWYAYQRAGIAFAVNRRFLATPGDATPPTPPVDMEEYRRQLGEILRRSPLYQGFPSDAIDTLVDRQHREIYGPGERIMRQGEPGSSMFVILEGQVDVLLEDEQGVEARVYSFGPGDTFGHMSLMTGAPRLSTVRALSHLVVAEIGKSDIAPLLEAYPDAIDRVAKEIMALESAGEELQRLRDSGSSATANPARLLNQIADRIRHFFAPATSDP
jgi:potassium efflux system protein